MSSEPKKVDRRSFIYAGLGAVALIAIGAAAYVALNPPVVTQTITTSTTVPTTSIVTTTVPTTSVVTTTVPTTTVITTTPTVTPSGSMTMYVEKGWYAEEEEAKKWLATMFKRETGISIELTSLSQEDILKKTAAGAMAGNPPDIVFCTTLSWMQDYAWKGWLEDLSEFIDTLKKLEVPDWAINAWKWNDGTKKKQILAGVPYATDNIPFTYWKDFLETAGLPSNPDSIPTKFNDFSNFWKEAQDKLWQKDPSTKDKVYGVGWPSMGGIGVNPGDGFQQMAHIMLWHGWKLEFDNKGLINLNASGNKDALKKTVEWFVETYNSGYMPKGILEWGSPDNNKAFNSRSIISVFNGTMSIPLNWYGQDKTVYFEKTATLPRFPSLTGERGVQTWEVHSWMVFSAGKNKELAKKFIKWFLDPGIINDFLKTTGGRFYPISRVVLESDPFWKEGKIDGGKKDPHLPTVYEMYKNGPNMPNPQHWFSHPWSYLDAYPMQAPHLVIEKGYSIDDAVNEVMNKWLQAIKPYQDEIRSW
ncbi:MAG: extracellular solute-binding protein [Nitrososphaeria archaeon]